MGHHPGQFRLVVRRQDQALVDVEKPAGEGEGVHLVGVNDLDVEGDLGVGVLDDVLSEPVHVFVDDRVFHQPGGLLELARHLFAQFDFFFERDPVGENPPDAPRDVPVPDIFDIFVLPGPGGRRRNHHRGQAPHGQFEGQGFHKSSAGGGCFIRRGSLSYPMRSRRDPVLHPYRRSRSAGVSSLIVGFFRRGVNRAPAAGGAGAVIGPGTGV